MDLILIPCNIMAINMMAIHVINQEDTRVLLWGIGLSLGTHTHWDCNLTIANHPSLPQQN